MYDTRVVLFGTSDKLKCFVQQLMVSRSNLLEGKSKRLVGI